MAQLRAHFNIDRDTLAEWLWSEPTRQRSGRSHAGEELRVQAVELRQEGYSVPQIASRLGAAKWVKHLPLHATVAQGVERRQLHSRRMTDSRWEPHRRARDAERVAVNAAEGAWVGVLSDREVLLIGAVTYWCEGSKDKPWRPNDCRLQFINSDPSLVLLFVRFVELLGIDRSTLRYRVSVHESADVRTVQQWWADVVGVSVDAFQRPNIKTHKPLTSRLNTGGSYRGCLVIYVPRSRRLYWRVEGIMRGIADATTSAGEAKM